MGVSRNLQKVFRRAVMAQLQFRHYVMWCLCMWHICMCVEDWRCIWKYAHVFWGDVGGKQDREQCVGMWWWRCVWKRSVFIDGYMYTCFDGIAQGGVRLCTFWSVYTLWVCVHLSRLVRVWSLFKSLPCSVTVWVETEIFLPVILCVWEKARVCVKERGSDGVRKKRQLQRSERSLIEQLRGMTVKPAFSFRLRFGPFLCIFLSFNLRDI